MTLKFSNMPQLNYGGNQASNWARRFPADMQSMATCPEHTPVIVCERTGYQHWAMQRNGIMKKLAPFQDWKTGATTWREDGSYVSDAIGWVMPRKKA
jgi:hypothetical protein